MNDTDGTMWNDLAVCCWPTLVLIGKQILQNYKYYYITFLSKTLYLFTNNKMYDIFCIGPNGEPMLVVQGEEFHSQLLPTFIETALQILRQASMISSHDIPEIVLGQSTLSLPLGKQTSVTKQHLLYPGKVFAYTKKLKKGKKEGSETSSNNLNYRQHGKILVAIADSGHHRVLICTLQGRVKVMH